MRIVKLAIFYGFKHGFKIEYNWARVAFECQNLLINIKNNYRKIYQELALGRIAGQLKTPV
jgi:hypothetical protein